MRIHLGHHFYGAGNLGDDFMLAGFLTATRALAPGATFTCCVPFALEPLRSRFPAIEWLPYENSTREQCIGACDVWLGLGGSPFQSALSRWFIDHLISDAQLCRRLNKPMFYLGVGVQTQDELNVPEVRRLCAEASAIWTRDAGSAERLRALPDAPMVEAAADLAHIFFRDVHPPAFKPRRLTLVANFDYGSWPGQQAFLHATRTLAADDFVWLAQEERELPGAERDLFRRLSSAEQLRWRLVSPEHSGAPLCEVLARWPSGEWLVTARYHAALCGAWAGSKIVVLTTNEKLRAAARELHAMSLSPAADATAVSHALEAATIAPSPHASAELAHAACEAFLRSAVAHRR